MKGYETQMSKVKHSGSARSGTSNHIKQRVTAVFLIPFTFWFAYSMIKIVTYPESLGDFILAPWSVFLSIFFIGNILYHGYLGMRDIIEDYVHCKMIKHSMLIALIALCSITFIGSCTTFFGLHLIYLLKN